MTALADLQARLERQLGTVETHKLATEGSAIRGDLAEVEARLSDCAMAHDLVCLAAAEIIAQAPCTDAATAARADAARAGWLFHLAMMARCQAWAKSPARKVPA